MIQVMKLQKKFGQVQALADVSFTVNTGEVVGFLGPNGAGKTTTLRILTGYLLPSAGTAMIADHNVADQSLALRRRIGYLPENNPLYDNMRVYEYLEFMARAKQLTNVQPDVKRVIAACQLQGYIASSIAELSKGYRQRVGLAAALLGDPDILLLDEPTSGLDPNQAADIRELIRTLGKTKTVLFSTHILQEVQAACDRALIIHHGKIVAEGTIQELLQQAKQQDQLGVEIVGQAERVLQELQRLSHVQTVTALEQQTYRVIVDPGKDIRRQVFELCVQQQWVLLEQRRSQASLEDVFRTLTK